MRSFVVLAAALSLVGQALAHPTLGRRATPIHPGGSEDIIITEDNTINATTTGPGNSTSPLFKVNAAQGNAQLPLTLTNNMAGQINAYVTGLDSNNALVILQPDGSFFYPTSNSSQSTPVAISANIAIPLGPQGSNTTITMPGYISSARVWFAEGSLQFFTVWNPATSAPSLVEPSFANPSDPSAGVNWGFVEFTNNAGGVYANISYVDFVGLVLGMTLVAGDGSKQSALGLHPGSVATICAGLQAQEAKDGQPWGELCQVNANGTALRTLSPNIYASSNSSAFSDYFSAYIDSVWTYYTTNNLTVNTQSGAGEVACIVSGGLLTCAGDNRSYAKPTQGDIFGCNSGTFAIEAADNGIHRAVVPRLCAAFNRGTLLLSGGNVQPSLLAAEYYPTSTPSTPSNIYSSLVHQNEIDGKGYAFSYDDVNPDGENQSGVVSDGNPQMLTVIVGGPAAY